VCVADNPRGGSWSSDGTILLVPDFQSPIFRVSDQGGKPEPVTVLDTTRNESSHRWPYALPDGKHFLYFSRISSKAGEAEGHAIYVSSMDGKENKLVVHTTANAIYANGYLLYLRGSTLLAQRFDQSSLQLQGDPVSIADGVINDPGFNLSVISASQTGILMFQQGNIHSGARLLVIDRTGKILQTVGDMIENFRVRYTPDANHLTASIFDPKMLRLNIWMYDLHTGGRNRITSGIGEDNPVMSPDGKTIIYASVQSGLNIYQKPINGATAEQCLLVSPTADLPLDWSRDGNSVLFSRSSQVRTHGNLWIMPMKGTHEVYPVANSDFDENAGRFSPDGKWIVYHSDESGDYEVYLRLAGKNETRTFKVSTDGGYLPCWAGNNNELCYVSRENKMMLVSLQYNNNEVEVVSARPLFAVPAFIESYDISSDGKTFVINRSLEMQKMAPLTVMVDWDKELKK